MVTTAALLLGILFLTPTTSAWSGSSSGSSRAPSRRAFFAGVGYIATTAAAAILPCEASLLDEYGTSATKIEQKPTVSKAAQLKPKNGAGVDPNLRSNYYYPTAKKRYLPRIKKASDNIPIAASMVGVEDWEEVGDFVKLSEDAILPMQLYASSLTGGGTNVKVANAGVLKSSAANFEKAQKCLAKVVQKKDRESASGALEKLSTSMLEYRTAAGLLGPEGGGDLPSIDEIRRSACRVQGRTFEKTVLARDARIKEGYIREDYQALLRKKGITNGGLGKADVRDLLKSKGKGISDDKEFAAVFTKFAPRGEMDEDRYIEFAQQYLK